MSAGAANGALAVPQTGLAAANSAMRIGAPMIPAKNPAGVIRPGDSNQNPAHLADQKPTLGNQPARLKAKPKPINPFTNNDFNQQNYRSQAS